jgi:deoxyribodipyrimidine photo-lyase
MNLLPEKINVFWFRRDLRLEDNHGLYQALRSGLPVLPIFIFDRNILDLLPDKRDGRVEFIHKQLAKINTSLNKSACRLLIRHGKPPELWDQLIHEFDIHTVFTNHDYEPYARERDEKIRVILNKKGIQFLTFKDQVIFERDEIVKQNKQPYTVYTPYRHSWQASLQAEHLRPYPSEKLVSKFMKNTVGGFPDLSQAGFRESGLTFPSRQIKKNIISSYDQTRDIPGLNGTTRLSIHLRFGTVSIRKLVQLALELNETWLAELIWREFFMMILYHFPQVQNQPFKTRFTRMSWRNDQQEFERWCTGQTGYALVDAGMRELNQTGFMHNRVRMVTASFLTKHLVTDWRRGERYFADKLLDYELSSNNGNWQWVTGCGCDAAPYFRIFNPITQQQKFDPDYRYIKKWIPELNSPAYPRPLVDHTLARQRALAVFGQIRF